MCDSMVQSLASQASDRQQQHYTAVISDAHVTDLMFHMTLSSACMVFVKLTAEEVLLWYKPLKRDNNATLTFHAHEIYFLIHACNIPMKCETPAAVLCCAVLCCAVLCCAVLCCAVLCCAVPCPDPRQSSGGSRVHSGQCAPGQT